MFKREFQPLRKTIPPHRKNYNNFMCLRSPISYWHINHPIQHNEWMAMHSIFERRITLTSSCKKGVNIINKIIHGCLNIWNLFSCAQLNILLICCAHSWDIKLNSQREIPYSTCLCILDIPCFLCSSVTRI